MRAFAIAVLLAGCAHVQEVPAPTAIAQAKPDRFEIEASALRDRNVKATSVPAYPERGVWTPTSDPDDALHALRSTDPMARAIALVFLARTQPVHEAIGILAKHADDHSTLRFPRTYDSVVSFTDTTVGEIAIDLASRIAEIHFDDASAVRWFAATHEHPKSIAAYWRAHLADLDELHRDNPALFLRVRLSTRIAHEPAKNAWDDPRVAIDAKLVPQAFVTAAEEKIDMSRDERLGLLAYAAHASRDIGVCAWSSRLEDAWRKSNPRDWQVSVELALLASRCQADGRTILHEEIARHPDRAIFVELLSTYGDRDHELLTDPAWEPHVEDAIMNGCFETRCDARHVLATIIGRSANAEIAMQLPDFLLMMAALDSSFTTPYPQVYEQWAEMRRTHGRPTFEMLRTITSMRIRASSW